MDQNKNFQIKKKTHMLNFIYIYKHKMKYGIEKEIKEKDIWYKEHWYSRHSLEGREDLGIFDRAGSLEL